MGNVWRLDDVFLLWHEGIWAIKILKSANASLKASRIDLESLRSS